MLKTNELAMPVLPANTKKLMCANSECGHLMIRSLEEGDKGEEGKLVSIYCSPSCYIQHNEVQHGSEFIDIFSKSLRTLGRRGSGLLENNWYLNQTEKINIKADGNGKRKVSIIPRDKKKENDSTAVV